MTVHRFLVEVELNDARERDTRPENVGPPEHWDASDLGAMLRPPRKDAGVKRAEVIDHSIVLDDVARARVRRRAS